MIILLVWRLHCRVYRNIIPSLGHVIYSLYVQNAFVQILMSPLDFDYYGQSFWEHWNAGMFVSLFSVFCIHIEEWN